MTGLTVAFGVLYLAALGFWLCGRLDRFLKNGGIRPYWDEETEQADQQSGND